MYLSIYLALHCSNRMLINKPTRNALSVRVLRVVKSQATKNYQVSIYINPGQINLRGQSWRSGKWLSSALHCRHTSLSVRYFLYTAVTNGINPLSITQNNNCFAVEIFVLPKKFNRGQLSQQRNFYGTVQRNPQHTPVQEIFPSSNNQNLSDGCYYESLCRQSIRQQKWPNQRRISTMGRSTELCRFRTSRKQSCCKVVLQIKIADQNIAFFFHSIEQNNTIISVQHNTVDIVSARSTCFTRPIFAHTFGHTPAKRLTQYTHQSQKNKPQRRCFQLVQRDRTLGFQIGC